jgi:hypothetical protein
MERLHCGPKHRATLMSMFGASCASTISILPPANPGARVMTPSWWPRPPMWSAFTPIRPPSIEALGKGHLNLRNGRALTGQSHDYKRRSTTTLFAALEVATGKIIASHSKRRRRVEFSRLHEQCRSRLPGQRASRHPRQSQHTQEERTLAQEIPQCAFHFTPTRSSN